MFGSSYNGTAIASSDIDILILHAPLDHTQVLYILRTMHTHPARPPRPHAGERRARAPLHCKGGEYTATAQAGGGCEEEWDVPAGGGGERQ
jgi:hypothetical protein